ncbi:hypothetical protein D0U02_13220 [Burkholderia pseudomallei]|uniref:Uncharacterized protein n=1 Tax=Burkholderia pseudomallei TaxID=28450 RepID=A0AAX0U0T0_BURPE|nr:hypothetical protein BHT10_14825 [Burkholderia pseudomallei]EIF78640.1 hypothetical protein BP354E_0045 [Burkholderia pseudomallei 354e]EIF82760.1 hypothetical protein BP354A_0071 [Burkholderia pseudomallei 354a]AYX34839.1 hypothetical protein EGY15_06435 [Burkholderia pseudomallei]KAA8770270.1 hypothetical protein F5D26_04030 [Burkholderia pseudomallei]
MYGHSQCMPKTYTLRITYKQTESTLAIVVSRVDTLLYVSELHPQKTYMRELAYAVEGLRGSLAR